MYTKFFGLNEKPFAITPDPRYLFMSERHGEGLAHLLYGVTDSGGFIQLTGEVGTGKTTLVRTLLSQLPAEVDVALILNPQVTVLEFLQAICRELDIELPEQRNSTMALVDTLNRYLLDAHARGRRIILLVDEAQNLSEEVLEQLRLLTNLETARQKLLQIILIGQPELREILAQNSLRQLAQRVTGRYHLEPLSRDEAAHYIDHRMKVAGGLGEIFNERAKREVYRLSGGIPRIMNVICDRALLGAYSLESRTVDAALIRGAAIEVSGEPGKAPRRKWLAGLAAAAGLAAVALLVLVLRGDFPPPATLTAASLTPEDALPPAATPNAEPGPLLAIDTDALAGQDAVATIPDPNTDSLHDRLRSGDLPVSIEDAMARLLGLWSVKFDPDLGRGCTQARTHGLSCLWQRGSFSVLRQLNRPAVLTLTDTTGATHEAVLVTLSGDSAELAFGDVTDTFSVTEIAELWFGQYMIVWRPPTDSPASIRPGTRGPDVAWLRRSLAELNGETASDSGDSDFYDAALESRVRSFQQQYRLQVDGLAGEQTQIIINSMLAEDSAPRLSGDI